jgi:hypothetical protein
MLEKISEKDIQRKRKSISELIDQLKIVQVYITKN